MTTYKGQTSEIHFLKSTSPVILYSDTFQLKVENSDVTTYRTNLDKKNSNGEFLLRNENALAITVGLRNVGFFGWKVSPPILLLSKEKCVAPKPTLLKPTAVIGDAYS